MHTHRRPISQPEGTRHHGFEANRLVAALTEQLPACRPLLLVLKEHASERSLSAAYTGGLSSYALVLMVARYLQEQQQQLDTGSLLLGFLDFYGARQPGEQVEPVPVSAKLAVGARVKQSEAGFSCRSGA